MAESGQQTPPVLFKSRNGGAACPGTSKLSTPPMGDSALGSEARQANSWPCQRPFPQSGRRRPVSVSFGRLPGPASSGTCPRGTVGSRSGGGFGSFGHNPVTPGSGSPGPREFRRSTARSLGRLCNEQVPAGGILSPDSRWGTLHGKQEPSRYREWNYPAVAARDFTASQCMASCASVKYWVGH